MTEILSAANAAAFLHKFIQDVEGAPELVQKLGEELRVLEKILAGIPVSSCDHGAELEQPLRYCENLLQELQAFAKTIDPNQYAKRRRRTWSQVKVALKHADLHKYLADIERSKSMLLQACNNLNRCVRRSLV